jgi:hypothetical protein
LAEAFAFQEMFDQLLEKTSTSTATTKTTTTAATTKTTTSTSTTKRTTNWANRTLHEKALLILLTCT